MAIGLILLIVTAFLENAFGGSQCPARLNIHPCICINVPQKRSADLKTVVVCRSLANSNSLLRIFSALKSIQMDQFHLYDSFWTTGNDDAERTLPPDWITHLRTIEYYIVDTPLSPSFPCGWSVKCKNGVTTKFTATNSSSAKEISTLCDTGTGDKFSWPNCFKELHNFEFSYGKLTALKSSLFSQPMQKLRVANFTHNQIRSIERNVLSKFPQLVSLDLSHNMLESLTNLSDKRMGYLEFLDVSWNMLKTVGFNVFSTLPSLKTFKLESNSLIQLNENDWKNIPKKFQLIDVRQNPIHCDCSMKWMNKTFPAKVKLQGHCGSPPESKNILLRRKSIHLNKTCKP